MRVLIAGCGYVGTALGQELVGDGATVFGLRRDPRALPDDIVGLRADLLDPPSLAGLPGDLDGVVYCATPGQRDDAGYRAAYVTGPQNLLAALHPQRPRFVFVSSTGVYAHTDGAWVDETSPTEPSYFSGQRLLEGETVAAGAPGGGVVVRLAGIYGPGRTRLLRSVRDGEARRRPGPPQYSNRIHRDDCAGALRHVLRLGDPAPCYVGVDHEPAPYNEVLAWLAAQLGVPEPPMGADPEERRVRAPSNKRCRNDRLVTAGYAFRYPTYREGYQQVLTEGWS